MWLGNGTPHSKDLFSWVHEHHGFRWLAMDKLTQGIYPLSRQFPRQRCERLLDIQLGYHELFSLPYWIRAWTFQESWLAKDDPLIICGAEQCWAGALTEGYRSFRKCLSRQQRRHLRAENRLLAHRTNFMLRSTHNHITVASSTPALKKFQSLPWAGDYHHSTDYVLHLSSERACTLDHDRVYSLFGCLEGLSDACPVDYRRPIGKVMHEFATYLVNTNALGMALHRFYFYQDRLEHTPSWVPDVRYSA
jgi:hypothetical protein